MILDGMFNRSAIKARGESETGGCRNIDIVPSQPIPRPDQSCQQRALLHLEKGVLDYQGRSNQRDKRNIKHYNLGHNID
jgi:hypothetical protein